jgi:hypothetical protein
VAEQATGIVGGTGGTEVPVVALPGTEHGGHHPGKTISWIAVAIITVGFIIGGYAMAPVGIAPNPVWWLFWTGAGIAIIGCVITLFAKTFNEDWY